MKYILIAFWLYVLTVIIWFVSAAVEFEWNKILLGCMYVVVAALHWVWYKDESKSF